MAKPRRKQNRIVVKSRKGRKSAPRKPRSVMISPYTDMILDPCNAVLAPGLHTSSEGILSRHKTVYTPTGAETSGYMLWSPYYSTNTAPVTGFAQATTIYYQNNASNVGPVNTLAQPAYTGTGGVTVTGLPITAGAAPFVLGQTCADFRLLSACMKVTYTGTMTNSQGTIAFIENLAPEAIFNTGVVGSTVAVDQLIQNSSKYQRFGISTEEVIFRPDPELSSEFHGDSISPIDLGAAAARLTQQSEEANRSQPTFFGFAWKGQAANTLVFEFVQNIEWRPSTQSGLVASTPTIVSPPNQMYHALQHLDSHMEGWTTTASRRVSQMSKALSIAEQAFTGASKVAKYGKPVVNWALRAAPMLI